MYGIVPYCHIKGNCDKTTMRDIDDCSFHIATLHCICICHN